MKHAYWAEADDTGIPPDDAEVSLDAKTYIRIAANNITLAVYARRMQLALIVSAILHLLVCAVFLGYAFRRKRTQGDLEPGK